MKFAAICSAVIGLLFVASVSMAVSAPEPLSVGMIPDAGATQVSIDE